MADGTAAGGSRISNPDAGAPKRSTALANPTDYFEMTFNAQAGTNYRLWMRGKAQGDFWGNDSIFIQFSDSVDGGGAPVYRIGTTGATEMNLEDCSGCGVQGWGWQDNGWGVGVLGPLIRFADIRHAHDSNSGKRRRPLARSDRAVGTNLSEHSSGNTEERQHDSAEVWQWWWSIFTGPDCILDLAELWSNRRRNFGDDFGNQFSIRRDRLTWRYAGNERRSC